MLLAAALLASGGFTACGDEADTSQTTGPDTVTSGQYVDQVNAICMAGNERIEALASESFNAGAEPTEDQLIEVLNGLLDEIVGQLDEIETLDAPADLAAGVDAWLADARATSEDVRSSGVAFFDQQASGVNPFADVNATALELGFDACGS
jgi:hypothetical protein